MVGEKMTQSLVKKLISIEKTEKIVLYGVGEFNGILVKNEPQISFLGILEPDSNEEQIYGIRILSYEEVQQLEAKVIVLTKQLISNQSEFHRLLEFCEKNAISLYDIYGNKINEYKNRIEMWNKNLLCIKEDKLIAAIDKYDVISFDIFDTLLIRKTLRPEDVFEIMQSKAEKIGIKVADFRKVRVDAQLNSGLNNPNIYEIYDQFQKLQYISDNTKEQLLNLEVEIEKQVLLGREAMIRIFHETLRRHKRVYLVSDMYLPKEILKEILGQNNINGYCDIIISCDYKKLKLEGLVKTCMEVARVKRLLHIGDHMIYDGICAEMVGADAFLISSPDYMTIHSKCAPILEQLKNVNDRNLWGLCRSRLFNNPFFLAEDNIAPCINKVYDRGYIFVAALVTTFMYWLVQKIRANNYEGILFAARDGYLINNLYSLMVKELNFENMPEGIYFQTSRKAAVMAVMDEEAIVKILIDSSFDMKPEEMMHERFGLSMEMILPYDTSIYGDSIHTYVWAHKKEIFTCAKRTRRNYFRYMGKSNLKIGKKYAFFDFVSSGTCQKALQKYAPFEMDGFYFIWNNLEESKEMSVESLFDSTERYLLAHYKRIEIFMTSLNGSLVEFDNEGEPVFHEENRTQEELKYIKEMQEAIMEYFCDYTQNLYLSGYDIESDVSETIYSLWEYFCDLQQDGEIIGRVLTDDWKNTKEIVI